MVDRYISTEMKLYNAARMLQVVLGMFENLSKMRSADFDKYQCAISLIESAKVELDRTSDELLMAAVDG